MAKFAADTVMDAALNRIKNNVNRLTVTAGQPATRASAITQGAQMLAQTTVSAGNFTVSDGDTSGRKVAVAQLTGLTVSATGGGNHVCLVTASTLEYVTTATSQTLTSGNSLNVNGWGVEFADPT